MLDVRTHNDITRDLLEALKERTWVEERILKHCNCCNDTWETCCSSCGAPEGDGYHGNWENFRQHKEGCALAALILEAETYLRIEEQLQQEQEAQGAA